MALIDNVVHEQSTTTGSGNMTIGALNGRQRFSEAFSTGGSDTFYYSIMNQDAGEWEIGTGSLADANTLVRDTVLASSNSGLAVTFSAGTKDVVNGIPQSDAALLSDLASTSNGFGASLIGIEDSGGLITATTVEGALSEIASDLATNYQPLDADLTSWAGVTRAAGFDTFATTPSSANLAALVTGETGSGALVFGTSPTLAGPTLTGTVALSSGGVLSWNSGDVTATHSANTLTFAGASSGYVFNDGNVGIGGTPTVKLHCFGDVGISDTSPQVDFYDTTDSSTSRILHDFAAFIFAVDTANIAANSNFRWQIDGSEVGRWTTTGLGIGTTSPAYPLDIAGASSPRIRVIDTTNTVQNQFGSDDTTGFFGSASNHNIRFITNNTTRLTIDSSGNVGIGTSSPGVRLHVESGSVENIAKFVNNAGTVIIACGTTNPTYGNFLMSRNETDTGYEGFGIKTNSGDPGFWIDTSNRLGLGTTSPTERLDINDDAIRIRTSQTPASAAAAGTAGMICWDSSYIYVCTATNTWKRVAIATW